MAMFRSYIKFILIIVIGVSFSCKKKKDDQWKIPTSVRFKMDINRTPCLGGNLVFTGGNLVLEYFTFDGKRNQGGEVYFMKNYEALNVPFDANNTVSEWNFDIPQGSYTQIKISYRTYGKPGDKQIVVLGTYKNTVSNITYPVRFEIDANGVYNVIAKTSAGSTQIVLEKDVEAIATMRMDPVYWFEEVTTAMMDGADLTVIDGKQTILINKSTNPTFHSAIKGRVSHDVTQIIFN